MLFNDNHLFCLTFPLQLQHALLHSLKSNKTIKGIAPLQYIALITSKHAFSESENIPRAFIMWNSPIKECRFARITNKKILEESKKKSPPVVLYRIYGDISFRTFDLFDRIGDVLVELFKLWSR